MSITRSVGYFVVNVAASFVDQSHMDGTLWQNHVRTVCEPKDCSKDLQICSQLFIQGFSRTETKESHRSEGYVQTLNSTSNNDDDVWRM